MIGSTPSRGALIGCGFVSQNHLAAWRLQEDARLVAVCDLDARRLERAGALVPEARRYLDANALFAGEPLDFVEICTRPETHVALVELAARHGVHVLCQKPAALTRDDLVAMIAACERSGVRLMIHENWRFRPWYRALRAAIDRGEIGRPIRLRLSHRETRALRPGGFADQPYFATMPRLILLEMGCHLVDTARFLLGEARSVAATVGRFGDGHLGDDLATLLIQFESGALGLLDMTWCAPAELARPEWALNQTVIEGTTGTLRLLADGALQGVDLDGRTRTIPVALPPAEGVYVDGYRATQAHFIEGVRRGAAHETSATETLKTMDIVWSAYRAAEQGRTVWLDPRNEPS
jgi:predicted dehydrogenase